MIQPLVVSLPAMVVKPVWQVCRIILFFTYRKIAYLKLHTSFFSKI